MALTPGEIIRHPVTAASSVFATLTLLFQVSAVDAVAAFIWANVGQLVTAGSLVSFTVIPELQLGQFEWLTGVAKVVTLLLIGVFLAKIGLGLYNQLQTRLSK